MAEIPHPAPTLHKREGGILSLTGPALRDLLRDVLAKGLPFRFRARGGSMDPFIKNDDVITVTPFNEKGARYGDVVAFIDPSGDRLVVHRVVRVSKDCCLVKGDNSILPDGWIVWEQILGYVTHIDRLQRPVRFGLGVERRIIAFLSCYNFLIPGIHILWPILRPFFKGI